MHNESGDIGTVMLDRAELRARLPMIGDAVRGAAFCPRDGHANPLKLLRSFQEALQRLGGAYLPNRSVEHIDHHPGRFTVHSGAETFAGEKLVIAAGLGSARLAPMVGLSMPVTPLRGEIVVTERVRPFLPCATHIARQTDEGSVLLGDSQEDAGFDTSTDVGVLQGIVARNLAAFPLLRDANIVRAWAALRVMTPDGCPIYQHSESHPGAFAATCHSGVTLAGAHALALAPAILAGHLPESLDAFHPQRFALSPAA
jgi:glycine/D-amino acid oxidase-like deaminating enzyme